MPLPINHIKLWPPEKHAADERWENDRRAGVEGERPPYLKPRTYFVYFSRSDIGPSGGVYNLSSHQAAVVIQRFVENRQIPFDELLADMSGAGFAYRHEDIQYIE